MFSKSNLSSTLRENIYFLRQELGAVHKLRKAFWGEGVYKSLTAPYEGEGGIGLSLTKAFQSLFKENAKIHLSG